MKTSKNKQKNILTVKFLMVIPNCNNASLLKQQRLSKCIYSATTSANKIVDLMTEQTSHVEIGKHQLTCLSVFSDHRRRFRNEEWAIAQAHGCQIAKIKPNNRQKMYPFNREALIWGFDTHICTTLQPHTWKLAY